MALQVFTASLLKEGHVVYLCMEEGNHSWSTDLAKATTADESAVALLKAEADKAEKNNMVIAPYAIDVEYSAAGLVPSTKREQIRASGPTFVLPQAGISSKASQGLHAA